MESVKQWETLWDTLKKYRYGILVLLIGIGLMLMPRSGGETEDPVILEETAPEANIDQQIADVLRSIQGVGEVEVLLTVATGEETLYQTDYETTQSGQKVKTVIVTGTQKNQQGLVCRIDPPKYLGAVVVCQGADSPAVCLAVMEAVSNLTGLGTDRISVLKMK